MKRLESDETPEDEDAQLRAARLGVIANVAVFAGIILLLKTGEMMLLVGTCSSCAHLHVPSCISSCVATVLC